jgi:nitroreductase
VDFFEVVERRKTTNGPFLPDPVEPEHQRILVEAASRAPSTFNSQPWRFVLIDDREKIERVAEISRDSMRHVMEEGSFWKNYSKWWRFSEEEMERERTGMLFDKMPRALRPFAKYVRTGVGQQMANRAGVPKTLSEDNYRLVAGSPLLMAVLLEKDWTQGTELQRFYGLFSMGAAMENVWLATVPLGMGIQFISFPMEAPGAWEKIARLIETPDDLELMAVYRLGYVPPDASRNRIDWTSRERKRIPQYVFRNSLANPEPE